MGCAVEEHAWRLPGVDACRHAFAAEGGYISTRAQAVPDYLLGASPKETTR